MGIGAAIAGAAAATAVGSVASGVIGGNAAKSAANTQAQAADQASQNALAQYQQTRADLLPYNQIGQPAATQLSSIISNLPQMLSNYGINGVQGLTFQPTQGQLAATPGYQFDLGQGLQSVQNSNAAQGRGISGAALKGAANYATGLANNTLTTQQGIFQQNLANQLGVMGTQLSGLQNLSNLGENAAATTGQQGVQAIGNANQYLTGGAAAQAAGTIGSANALSSGLSGLSQSPLNYLLLSQLTQGAPTSAGNAIAGFGSNGNAQY